MHFLKDFVIQRFFFLHITNLFEIIKRDIWAYEKFRLGCYVKCLVFRTKTLKILYIFTARSCNTTQFSRFFCCSDELSVILQVLAVQNIEKFGGFFTFKTSQLLKDFVIPRRTIFTTAKKKKTRKLCRIAATCRENVQKLQCFDLRNQAFYVTCQIKIFKCNKYFYLLHKMLLTIIHMCCVYCVYCVCVLCALCMRCMLCMCYVCCMCCVRCGVLYWWYSVLVVFCLYLQTFHGYFTLWFVGASQYLSCRKKCSTNHRSNWRSVLVSPWYRDTNFGIFFQ